MSEVRDRLDLSGYAYHQLAERLRAYFISFSDSEGKLARFIVERNKVYITDITIFEYDLK
jgi:hypothetical protein